MVVDKYVGRCLDVGSTPTGSIDNLHCFVNLSKTLFLQRFLFLSLVFLCKKEYTTDGLHLSIAGYQILTKALKDYLL